MKQILFVVAFLATTLAASAQVGRFKCFEDKIKYKNGRSDLNIDWQPADIVVVINYKENKVQVFAKSELDIDIIQNINANSFLDQNEYLESNEKGIDQDGKKCVVSFLVYKPPVDVHVATLCVEYKDCTMYYRLKND